MLYQELKNRKLPPLKSREEMVEILQREVYGDFPSPKEFTVSASEPVSVEKRYCCGDVEHSYVDLTITLPTGSHTFRVDRLLHTDGKKRPMVLLNNIHRMNDSQYFAKEELSEYDVDYLVYCFKDITSDDGDFSTGLAPLLLPNGRDCDTAPGKICMWAWGSMRVLDYALTLSGTDPDNIAVAGHSRLGKTALVTGMMDKRIKFVFSNAAGCAGDSIAHGSTGLAAPGSYGTAGRGENIEDICRTFPYWFCKNYQKYIVPKVSEEFDQHYLLATIAPRFVMVGSCSLDDWADQKSQQLCALAASEAWENMGLLGLVGSDRYLEPGESLDEGRVGFFMIKAKHFLSRHSWKHFLAFVEKHRYDKI